MIQVLDHGYVELHDCMGDDLRIVNMARQSFGQKSVSVGPKEEGLIGFLMKHRHGTPFEGPVFTFNVKCPIFVAREWMRHRIGSFNEYSGRYSKMIEEFYIPATEQVRRQKGKAGEYTFTPCSEEVASAAKEIIAYNNAHAWRHYESLLDLGVAKEVARMVLPVNLYTQFTWVVNLRSLFNFIALRSNDRAMWEIRQYSLQIEELIQELVPVAYQAFVDNGRIAP
jgi:thymidylate synthase (FAD)